MIAMITSSIGKLLMALVAVGAILMGATRYGKSTEKAATKVKTLKDFIETKERIDHVEVSPTRDGASKRLRDNGWVR
jgi:hypothetical protein